MSRSRHLGPTAAAFVDGALDLAARDAVISHLAVCPACRAEVAEQRRVKALLAGLPRPEVPDALVVRLAAIAAVQREAAPAILPLTGTPPAGLRAGHRRSRRAVRAVAGAGAAAALVTVAAAGLGGSQAAAEPTIAPPVQQFAVEHAAVTGGMPLSAPGLRLSQAVLLGGAAPGLATAPVSVAWQLPGALAPVAP